MSSFGRTDIHPFACHCQCAYNKKLFEFVAAGVAAGAVTFFGLRALFKPSESKPSATFLTDGGHGPDSIEYSMADQPARFAFQKKTNCTRALEIEKVFKPEELKGKRVLITGTSRGLGLAITKAAVACGAIVIATCRKPSAELSKIEVRSVRVAVDYGNAMR